MWQLLPPPTPPLNQCLLFSEHTSAPDLYPLFSQKFWMHLRAQPRSRQSSDAELALIHHSRAMTFHVSVSARQSQCSYFLQRPLFSLTTKVQTSLSFKVLFVRSSFSSWLLVLSSHSRPLSALLQIRTQACDRGALLLPILHVLPVSKFYITALCSASLKYLHYNGWSLLPCPIDVRLEHMTCFNQRNMGRSDISFRLRPQETLLIPLAFLAFLWSIRNRALQKYPLQLGPHYKYPWSRSESHPQTVRKRNVVCQQILGGLSYGIMAAIAD